MTRPLAVGPLLSGIESPEDLRALREEELPQLVAELRDFIIDNVSKYGGHFGASLGVVELTVALHYVFERHTISWSGMWDTRRMDIRF